MTTKAVQQEAVSTKLIGRWEQVGEKLSALGQAIPENGYDYKPADAVRSVSEVLRHVAFWNRYLADTILGRPADDKGNELPKEEFSTKALILDAFVRSISDVAKAMQGSPKPLSPETSEMLVTFIEHNSEHYGQLVVYARLNGIIPPASRQ